MSENENKPVKLRKPIEVGSTSISEIDVREPSMGDIEDAAKQGGNNVTIGIRLLEKLAFCPEHPDVPITAAMLRKLPLKEGMELNNRVAAFFPEGLPIGAIA